jgi:hypothetical protein
MEYQGNTDKSREEKKPEKQIEKVVTGEVVQKPKTIGRKFKDVFFGGDLRTATRYIAGDVLLPALRNLIVDMTSKGIERIVYGESGIRRRSSVDYRPRVSYNTSYNNPIYRDPRAAGRPLPDQPRMNRERKESVDLVLASKEEAERVVEQLIDIIDKYDVVSWADLCELVGWPSSHVDNKWGWTYLTNVDIRQTRDGYLIDLPPMEAI